MTSDQEQRLAILEAVQWAVDHPLDLVRIATDSDTESDAVWAIMRQSGLTEWQSEFCLSMPFRRLMRKNREQLAAELREIRESMGQD
ncbi:hypothetical protein C8K38_113168 [Rhodococcus sp. OK611]|uniref:hypothetical protein n=1 Tax=unclassified Rhodococcus (in: high G+C Gram-positive bacteria) TaxID=192944 RepID=UPI000BC3B14A|nr:MULTISPECIES: hypothetical protein [unclassified Rhodococcus (in: high G+C Gram-positive bacteria)]PTR40642.1 hypothetical protein C8K38_113168 [Rhodococcus sp. OK611]SNX92333.1 hypothetical protein SAMN05447004_113168 [Rhodococcus sp. OK270]